MLSLKVLFGKRLKLLRQSKGMVQEKLAERANISVDFISLVERGINSPSFETIEKLANALSVSVRDLFDFSDIIDH